MPKLALTLPAHLTASASLCSTRASASVSLVSPEILRAELVVYPFPYMVATLTPIAPPPLIFVWQVKQVSEAASTAVFALTVAKTPSASWRTEWPSVAVLL